MTKQNETDVKRKQDDEISIMAKCHRLLMRLPDDARKRSANWLAERHGGPVKPDGSLLPGINKT